MNFINNNNNNNNKKLTKNAPTKSRICDMAVVYGDVGFTRTRHTLHLSINGK